MRLNKENESVEHVPVAIPDPSNVMQVETPKERIVVPLPQVKEAPFYEQFDVCNPILGNNSTPRSRFVPQLESQLDNSWLKPCTDIYHTPLGIRSELNC